MEELQNIINKLPINVKDILYSDEYFAKFKSIADKFGLNTEQSGILMEELVYVMAGLTHPDDFIEELQKELGFDRGKAIEVGSEIDNVILKSIRADLIRIYNGEETGEGGRVNEDGDIDRDEIMRGIEDPGTIHKVGEIIESHDFIESQPSSEFVGSVSGEQRDEMLKEIENPEPAVPKKTLLEDKLGTVVKADREEKTESEETPPTWKQPIDPYREAIE